MRFFFQLLCISVVVAFAGFGMSGCTSKKIDKSVQQTSRYFKTVGHLNYGYDPGVFVPLRDGKILALGGQKFTEQGQEEEFFQAEDGKRYGDGKGMVELFDPETGETKVLTKMPFYFRPFSSPTVQQMQAIELNNGRIFMVGRFDDQRPDSEKTKQCGKSLAERWQYLPFYSKVEPTRQLRSITPCTEPNLFGVIYDWHNQTFELVHTTPDIPPRFMVAMNLLPDGRVLITGGGVSIDHSKGAYGSWQEFPETRVLIFDPKTKQLNTVGNLQHPRYGHQTVVLNDTEFFLFGGWGVSEEEEKKSSCTYYSRESAQCQSREPWHQTREVEAFNLKTGSSQIVGHILSGRYGFSAIPLSNEKVFIHGGPVGSLLGHYASELYDIKTGTTVYVGEKREQEEIEKGPSGNWDDPYQFFGEGIWFRAILKDDVLLLMGTDLAFIYPWQKLLKTPTLDEHSAPEKLFVPRLEHQLIKTPNGRVYVMGGLMNKYFDGVHVQGESYADLIEEFIY